MRQHRKQLLQYAVTRAKERPRISPEAKQQIMEEDIAYNQARNKAYLSEKGHIWQRPEVKVPRKRLEYNPRKDLRHEWRLHKDVSEDEFRLYDPYNFTWFRDHYMGSLGDLLERINGTDAEEHIDPYYFFTPLEDIPLLSEEDEQQYEGKLREATLDQMEPGRRNRMLDLEEFTEEELGGLPEEVDPIEAYATIETKYMDLNYQHATFIPYSVKRDEMELFFPDCDDIAADIIGWVRELGVSSKLNDIPWWAKYGVADVVRKIGLDNIDKEVKVLAQEEKARKEGKDVAPSLRYMDVEKIPDEELESVEQRMIGEKLLRPEKTYLDIRKSWWWDGFNRIGWSDDSPRWWLGEPDRNPRIRPHQNKDWDEVDMLPEKNQFKLGDRFAGDPRPYDYYHYENYFLGDTWGDLPGMLLFTVPLYYVFGVVHGLSLYQQGKVGLFPDQQKYLWKNVVWGQPKDFMARFLPLAIMVHFAERPFKEEFHAYNQSFARTLDRYNHPPVDWAAKTTSMFAVSTFYGYMFGYIYRWRIISGCTALAAFIHFPQMEYWKVNWKHDWKVFKYRWFGIRTSPELRDYTKWRFKYAKRVDDLGLKATPDEIKAAMKNHGFYAQPEGAPIPASGDFQPRYTPRQPTPRDDWRSDDWPQKHVGFKERLKMNQQLLDGGVGKFVNPFGTRKGRIPDKNYRDRFTDRQRLDARSRAAWWKDYATKYNDRRPIFDERERHAAAEYMAKKALLKKTQEETKGK